MASLLDLIRARRAELEVTAALGRDDEQAQQLEASFIDFVEAGWPALDPAEYQSCWAIDALCEHLQAVSEGQIRHLLVNAPPRCSKTTIALEVIPLEIRRGEDIVPAFEALNDRAEALYVLIDPITNTHRGRINTLALAERLPTMHAIREGVEAGGLMSYGPNIPDLFRRAGDYVDKILRRSWRRETLLVRLMFWRATSASKVEVQFE